MTDEKLFEKSTKTAAGNERQINRAKHIYYNDELIGNVEISVTQKQSDQFTKQLLVASIGALFISIMGLVVAMSMITRLTKELETSNRSLQKEMAERKKRRK